MRHVTRVILILVSVFLASCASTPAKPVVFQDGCSVVDVIGGQGFARSGGTIVNGTDEYLSLVVDGELLSLTNREGVARQLCLEPGGSYTIPLIYIPFSYRDTISVVVRGVDVVGNKTGFVAKRTFRIGNGRSYRDQVWIVR